MSDENRETEVEQELVKLGWTSDEWYTANHIQVFKQYRPKKHTNEWTVYCKMPVWKWDFIMYQAPYGSKAAWFGDWNPNPHEWLSNLRLDFEIPAEIDDAKEIAKYMNDELEDWFDNAPYNEWSGAWANPVQRVTDRPK